MSLSPFYLGQVISTVLEQVDHGGQHSNAVWTRIGDETAETDRTQKQRCRYSAIYETIKNLAILRCICGSRIVLLGMVTEKCGIPVTNISQKMSKAYSLSNINLRLRTTNKQQWTYISFLPKYLYYIFFLIIIGVYLLSILSLICCKVFNILWQK